MDIVNIEGFPDFKLLSGILLLHECIFKDSDVLVSKASSKSELVFTIGLLDGKVVGYKIGYELKSGIFYSWLGGVDENYRKMGIASKLMKHQHLYLKDQDYTIVQTKTKNEWRNMLILNIKNGFDVIGTYRDDKDDLKILLEKIL